MIRGKQKRWKLRTVIYNPILNKCWTFCTGKELCRNYKQRYAWSYCGNEDDFLSRINTHYGSLYKRT
jgi:fructose-1,6-bisphosphatase/inositol monophosphatase family enzyme